LAKVGIVEASGEELQSLTKLVANPVLKNLAAVDLGPGLDGDL